MSSLMGARDDRKVTPGITELSRLRAHIDGAVCYIDVGSSYPGRAEKGLHPNEKRHCLLMDGVCLLASKGGGVHPLKGIVSWVQNVVRQFV